MTEKQIKWKVVNPLSRERIEEHRKRIGMKLRPSGNYRGRNQWVHWDRISSYAERLGDPNPLWHDEEYAKKTRYGRMPAPPGFLPGGMIIQGLPGVQVMVGGAAYEFYKPVLEGDRMTYETTFAELEEKGSTFSTLWLIEHYDSLYYNQRGELLAKVRAHMLRWERGDIDEGLKRTDKAKLASLPHRWTEEEIRQVEDEVLGEVDNIRGATPRYWEDVSVGETLPDLVRGPRRIYDAVVETVATKVWRSWTVNLVEMQRHPGSFFYHPETKAHEDMAIITYDRLAAEQTGYPHSPDNGRVRQYNAIEAIIDWMGDDGWLKKHSAQLRRPVYIADVTRVKSKVIKKYVDEDGEYCLDIEQHMINQRGDDVMPAQATVALPSREKGTWPVSIRVPH